jgi:hypothetical protein
MRRKCKNWNTFWQPSAKIELFILEREGAFFRYETNKMATETATEGCKLIFLKTYILILIELSWTQV